MAAKYRRAKWLMRPLPDLILPSSAMHAPIQYAMFAAERAKVVGDMLTTLLEVLFLANDSIHLLQKCLIEDARLPFHSPPQGTASGSS